MQPTPASKNDTKLPRAILRRSAAIDARYAKPAEPEPLIPASDAAPATLPAVAPAPPADPQPPAPAGDPRDSDPNYWKQRFSVTEGILRRERNDHTAMTENLHQRVAELEGQVRTSQAKAPVADDEIDLAQFYTPAQIEQYGEEQCKVMASTAMRAAKKEAQTMIDAAVQPLKEERTRNAANDAQAKKQTFTDKLTELYPSWAAVDVDPRWLAWLKEDDDNGVQRQELLNIHIGTMNAQQCARMFKAWEKTVTVAAPPPPPAPPITPAGSGANPGPENPGAPPPPDAASMKPPTSAEVKDYFKRAATVRKGQPGYVTDQERIDFEARMRLRSGAR